MEIRKFQENGFLSISPEDLILYYTYFIKHILSVLKISKPSEYLARYGQWSVFMIRFQESVVKTDLCLYFIEYSPDVYKKKTRVFNIFNKDEKCFIKINIESSHQEISISTRFLEINGSPSLFITELSSFLFTPYNPPIQLRVKWIKNQKHSRIFL